MEDRVPDTPLRRGKDEQASSILISDSEADGMYSEDEETIATVPLQAYRAPAPATQYITQPTQLVDNNNDNNNKSPATLAKSTPPPPPQSGVVQVATSSPLAPTSHASSRPPFARPVRKPGILSNAMAPVGTRFRAPTFVPMPQLAPARRNITEDDGPTYRGGSSDEDDIEIVGVTDIKPSTFTKTTSRNADKERVAESPLGQREGGKTFKEITAAAFYRPGAGSLTAMAEKRKADGTMATGGAGSNEPLSKKPRSGYNHTTDHSRYLSTIADYQIREKVRRMLGVFPHQDPQVCHRVLLAKKANFNDAMDHLGSLDEDETGQVSSEDELSAGRKPIIRPPPRIPPPAKQEIKARSRIQDRWTSGQQPKSEPSAPRTGRRLVRGQRSRAESPRGAVPVPPKRPGKLIRGRKSRSPSRSASPELHFIESDTSDAESDLQIEDENSLEEKVLNFFNTCSVEDLADIAEISADLANVLISKRPFSTLAAVRQVKNDEAENKASGATKNRKSSKKPFGDKVTDKCLDMWSGYEAVDELVSKCESLGKPIAEEMKRWGVDVFGCKKQGELELASLDRLAADKNNDSGIGTPSTNRSSSEEATARPKSSFISQPAIMSESITLKDYQVVGLNWINLIFEQKLSCILADDMGLGKTCQVISFLAHLLETGVTGPHLVVVPASTLENWLREFSVFCPKLRVMPYYADQATRARIRQEIEDGKDEINVVITTYTIAKAKYDSAFLRTMDFCACVYDEGHMLKSSKSLLYEKLILIPARFRLLLTGTPLQNNLQELASLLGFILPSVFRERKADLESIFSAKAKTVDDTHSALLSAQRIARAKSMLTPFVLRRKKHQVIDLPPKTSRVEYCTMTKEQAEIYQNEIETVKRLVADRAAGKKVVGKNANILMKLRQAAIHPLFYRRLYDDKTLSRMSKACLKEDQWALSDPDQIYAELQAYNDFECHTLCTKNPKSLSKFALKNEEWMQSGKVDKLCELLKKYTENGDRILLFSQFTMVMDILENVLQTLAIPFFRLDGTTSVEDRQSILDAFYAKVEIPVFMLSTKAGGAGINLACANKVIIFDSSFNPQEDIQAENRAHRVGQTREVEVVRLVTKDTIEEQMYALGQTKLALDQRVAGDDEGAGLSKKTEEAGLQAVQDMVFAKLEQPDVVPDATDSKT